MSWRGNWKSAFSNWRGAGFKQQRADVHDIETGGVFVTGAGGFIGSTVVQALAGQGAAIKALVGAPGQAFRPAPAPVISAVADITDVAALCDLASGCQVAVHMAGPASVLESFEAATEYSRVHVCGTAAFLEACRRTGVGHVVYLSSAEVYGRPDTNPVGEDTPPGPRSPYAAAKAGAEHMIGAYARTYGLRTVVLRPFSIYGPRMSTRSIIGTVLRAACAGEPVVVADPRPVRDYCYVGDLARAIVCACSTDAAGTFNIGSGTGVSVLELVRKICGIGGFIADVRVRPDAGRRAAADIHCLVADARRAASVLGWRPRVSLDTGLERTIEWFRSSIS
jgi:nucleoside-diphosphate-sugar epimerase